MTDGMTKVKMQKVELLAEFDRNRDRREGGCRDFSGKAGERCHVQTYEPTSGKKKQDSGPPLEMNEIFFRSLTEIITRGNDN